MAGEGASVTLERGDWGLGGNEESVMRQGWDYRARKNEGEDR